MNRQESDILIQLVNEPYVNQRRLAESTGYSLGIINRSLKSLLSEGYIDSHINLTDRAKQELQNKTPFNAVILAAGYGMRMVPINMETPKGLIEVHGEALIERLIRQLQEVGIEQILIVVGFMKENYEYLIDKYNVQLIVNEEYAEKNNLYSMNKVLKYLGNTYILPCDIWCESNPFSSNELYSWYMVSDLVESDSAIRVNRKGELTVVTGESGGNAMLGIAYLLKNEADIVKQRVSELCKDKRYEDAFWEEALYEKNKMIVPAKVAHYENVIEINTYEQLRELDSQSGQLKTDTITVIAKELGVGEEDISDLTVMKKGMTNRSFLFHCLGEKYIMRIPGEGTDQLINRKEEAAVYGVIQGKNICDEPIYINPHNGYKITKYLNNARVCDPLNMEDVSKCMKQLHKFHEMEFQVEHEFNIFRQIEFYETLWEGKPSVYKDYKKTKENIFMLKPYIESHVEKKILTHIDAVPDNFLFITTPDGTEEIRLIDWEYAGMQDPHVDIAMFAIYALYDREQVENLIDAYFVEGCSKEVRIKIYCYIASCGLLWSNWCEYKRALGVEFGEYSLRQYRYAKDYYRLVQNEINKDGV